MYVLLSAKSCPGGQRLAARPPTIALPESTFSHEGETPLSRVVWTGLHQDRLWLVKGPNIGRNASVLCRFRPLSALPAVRSSWADSCAERGQPQAKTRATCASLTEMRPAQWVATYAWRCYCWHMRKTVKGATCTFQLVSGLSFLLV